MVGWEPLRLETDISPSTGKNMGKGQMRGIRRRKKKKKQKEKKKKK